MNKDILVINDNKFKSIFITVNYIRKLDRKEAGKNALLASILRKGTKNLKTEKELELELAKLYSSSIAVNVEKIGGIYKVEFGVEFINKKYINEDVSDKVINILNDIIYNPYLEEGVFSREYFIREKEALLEKINQEQNDKRKWALRRLEEEMYDESDYKVASLGDADEIAKETEKTIYEYYKEFLKTSEIKIVITGNLDGYDDLEDKLRIKFLNGVSNKINALEIKNREKLKEIKDYETLNQSILCFGLNVKNTDANMIPAVTVYNSILGGTPASKLFQNVREKESLAYFAKSQYNKYINAIYIYSGIDLSKKEKATTVIKNQLEDLKNGNITEEELDTAKKNIVLTYKALSDSKIMYNRAVLANKYYNEDFDINKFIEEIEKVTIDDIVNIAKDIEVNTIYLLGGKIDE